MGRWREEVDIEPTEEEAKVDDGHLGRHVSMFNRCNDGSIHVPQPNRPPVPIVTHEVTIASMMLGTFWSPTGNCVTHVEYTV
jgi:hypothetical protein